MPSHRSIVIFSGGTAANHLVDIFESIRKSKDCPLSYIIPISDNGGSSSELIRVFGGPGIGDVRSRLVRLIARLPQGSPGFTEREAIRALFNYRLSSTDARTAKSQWTDVVDGTSHLWKDVSSAKKELIRSFLNVVNAEITKRSRPPTSTFDFTSASVGNLFLTGARLFSGSFESAIYLLGSICGIEDEGVKVIPSINSNFSHHIAAGLEDGSVIVGQNAISHPSPIAVIASAETVLAKRIAAAHAAAAAASNQETTRRPSGKDHYYGDEHEAEHETFLDHNQEEEEEEDANLPGTLPTLRTRNIQFNKEAHLNADLPARISRIWYINPYGQEILPPANPRAIQALNNAQAVIYSIGSLYTSLVPSLVLRGVGDALRRNTSAGGSGLRTKILILNGCLDREVGPGTFSAADFVEAIVRAGEQSRGVAWEADEAGSPDTSENEGVPCDSSGGNTPEKSHGPSSNTNASHSKSKPSSRPSLTSSKSENILRTTLKTSTLATAQRKQHQHQQRQYQQHLFPSPLPASTATSQVASREPSPTRSHSRSPSPSTAHSESQTQSREPSSHGATTTPPNPIYTHYITHIIHLPNSASTPHVDKSLLASKYGIKTIRVYGRTTPDGQGMRYDTEALRGAILAVLGSRAERETAGDDRESGGHVQVRGGGVGRGRANGVAEREWSWRVGVRRNTLDG